MIALVVRLQAGPGNADAVEAELKSMAQAVHAQEPGCRAYVLHRSDDDADLFVLYEQYDDLPALEAHRNSEHFRKHIEGAVIPLLSGRTRDLLTVVA